MITITIITITKGRRPRKRVSTGGGPGSVRA